MPKKVKNKETTDYSEIASRIQPATEHQSHLSALVYGKSGTGKTAFAGTWPKPLLLIDVREKGTETIANVPGIDAVRIDKWEEFEQVYWYLVSGKAKYSTVAIDQISNLQNLLMDKIRKDSGMTETDTLNKRDWGQISGGMQTWLFNYRDLVDRQMHVLFLAHERSNVTEDTIEDQLDPSITARLMPSLSSVVNGAVSVIGNTFIRERFIGEEKARIVEYCMRLGPHAYYTTKIRTPVDFESPDSIVNPSFEKIAALVKCQPLKPKKAVKRGAK